MPAFAPLQPSDLGLILSYKCQAACAHCLYNCGPGWQDWMKPEQVRAALEATSHWPQPFQVHLTGGEPFLNFPLLLQAAEIATQLGIRYYVETNAGWCVRETLVEERFRTLKSAGLKAVLISCSPFHAEAIPPKRTILAIQKALEIFGPQGTIVYLPEWLDQILLFNPEMTTPLEKYVELYGAHEAGELLWRGYGLISGGRSGYRLGHLTARHPAAAFRGQNCRHEILSAHHSHFDLYGNFISSFCGGLRVGDWHDLPQLMENYREEHYPKLIGILIRSGPYGLLTLAQEVHKYQESADGYAGKCHLCVDVRRHLAVHGEYAELQPEAFYEMI
jgi:hypothetical protein